MNDVPVLDKEMSTTGKTYLIVLWKICFCISIL